MLQRILICVSIAASYLLAGTAVAAERAFVIGITHYKNIDPLDNPEIDANAVAKKLANAHYEVTLVLNADAAKIPLLKAWNSFLSKVKKGDNIVVYYSGHGVDVKGANYLVEQDSPAFADMGGETGMQSNLIAFHDLMQALEDREVGMQVWIIDACRSDPFVRGGRPLVSKGGLTGDIDQPNRFVLYSANYGQIAMDRLPSDPPKATLGSPFSRLFVSLFDSWKDRSIRDFAAELRQKTIASVAPLPQFPVWEDGVLPLWCFIKCEEADIQKAIVQNEEIARKLTAISRLVAREKYPLQPLEFFYNFEFPMDQPMLKAYASRVQTDIVEYLRKTREGRGKTSDSLADENAIFVLSNNKDWKPRSGPGEESQAQRLLNDQANFVFTDNKLQSIMFACLPTTDANFLVTMNRVGKPKIEVKLNADYKVRVFIKSVWCQNPVRMGTDNIAFSSVDLIGRTLTWNDDEIYGLKTRLTSFFMRFSYDYGFQQRSSDPETPPKGREIPVAGAKSSTVLAKHVGLTDDVVAPAAVPAQQ